MKILFFSSYFHPYISGLTTYPWKILNHLSKNHQITVLTFNHQENKLIINNKKLKIIYLPYFFRLSKGFISPQSLFYFLKEIKRSNILILNQPNFEGLLLALLGKIYGKKILSIFHCEVKPSFNFISIISTLFLNISVFIQCALSNIIITYTKDYINHLAIGKLFLKKIKICLPPIQLFKSDNVLYEKLIHQKGNQIWIGYAGRIAHEKGLEYLIEAIAILKKIFPSIKLVIAGPYGNQVVGENNYFLKIKKLLVSNKISYKLFGNLNSAQLASYYKIIDVLVLPSIDKTEAFGMVQAEAMLQGTPVVTTNLPGVRIPITLTKMGIITNLKNAKKLACSIKKVLINKNKYSHLLLINNAKKIFNIKKVYQFWEKIIKINEGRN